MIKCNGGRTATLHLCVLFLFTTVTGFPCSLKKTELLLWSFKYLKRTKILLWFLSLPFLFFLASSKQSFFSCPPLPKMTLLSSAFPLNLSLPIRIAMLLYSIGGSHYNFVNTMCLIDSLKTSFEFSS